MNIVDQDDEELKENRTYAFLSAQPFTITETVIKYSSLTKLLRIIAHCIRFSNNTRPANIKYVRPITVSEIEKAHNFVIKSCQNLEYSEEITILKQHRNLNSKSKILSLNPFVDDDNMLRVGGRLRNSEMHNINKHQIIIPTKSHIEWLIIDKAHKETLHGGIQLTLSKIRA